MTRLPAAISLRRAEELVAPTLVAGSVLHPSRTATSIVDERVAPALRSVVMMVHDRRIDRRVLDEARSLIGDGWAVTVIAGPADPTQPTPDEQVYPDVPIVRVIRGAAPLASIPSRLELAASVPWRRFSPYHHEFVEEALRRPATAYVAHDLPQLGAAVIAAQHHGGYVVYDSHELFPEQRTLLSQGLAWLLVALERWLIAYADRVITVNESIADFIAARYRVPRPDVILNCPNQVEPVERSDRLRQSLSVPSDVPLLLFQGGYADTRNLENLVEAMALIRHEAVLVLMGPGFETGSPLRHLADDLGVAGRQVFFHQAVGQDELLSYTASADAGVIPYMPRDELSVYWCTPNKLFEFMVAGLPILATDLPELRRFVSGNGIGLNRPMRSAKEVADAIDEFLDSDVTRFRQRVEIVRADFTWAAQGARLTELYRDLLDRDPKSLRAVPEADEPAAAIPRSFAGMLTERSILAATPGDALLREARRRGAAKIGRTIDLAARVVHAVENRG